MTLPCELASNFRMPPWRRLKWPSWSIPVQSCLRSTSSRISLWMRLFRNTITKVYAPSESMASTASFRCWPSPRGQGSILGAETSAHVRVVRDSDRRLAQTTFWRPGEGTPNPKATNQNTPLIHVSFENTYIVAAVSGCGQTETIDNRDRDHETMK